MLSPARVALVLASLAGCSELVGRSDRAITNGTADDGDPAVAALVDASGNAYCTATLITPNAVITAAHCLDGIQPAHVFFGSAPGASPAMNGLSVPVASVQMQPDYNSDTHANDLGLVVLAASPAIDPVPIYSRSFDASFAGKTIRLVGFGSASAFDTAAPRKRSGAARIQKFTETEFSFGPAPSQTCFGDSGGPAFARLDGVEYLVGVTSNGDSECRAGGIDMRVGALATGFIEGYLANAAGPPTVIGGCSMAMATGAPDGLLLSALALVVLRALQGMTRRRKA